MMSIMTRNIDVALLRALVTTVDSGGVGAAARALNLTQGAVSQQLIRLETLLGRKLLARDHKGARPTRAGHAVMATAREIIALNDQLWAEATATREPVRLGAPPDIVSARLAGLLRAFAERAPDQEVSVLSAPSAVLEQALAAGSLDLALAQHPLDQDHGQRLKVEPLVWIGAREGRAWRSTPIPVSISHKACLCRPIVAAALEASGATWRPVLDDEGLETTLAAVRADLAVTAALKTLVPDGVEILDVSALPPLPLLATSLLYAPGQTSKAVQLLADVLVEDLATA